jgi:cytochrome c biogenesis protein CcdA
MSSPESRRGLRNTLLFIVVLALVVLVFWATDLLNGNVPGLREIARGALIIVGLFVLGVITENVGRVSVDVANIKANMGSDNQKDGGDGS